MKNYAIILASGSGKRFKSNLPKQFVKINGKTIIEYSIEAFESSKYIDYIIVVINPHYKDLVNTIIKNNNYKKIIKIINGGKERKDSSCIGVNSIDETEANVLIHDCARPFISLNIIEQCAKALKEFNAVAPAINTPDTIIEVKDNILISIPKRQNLMRVQTPQCFKLSLIKKAHELSKNDTEFTDDCGLILKHHLSDIHIVNGSEQNIKITYPEDIKYAEYIFNTRISNN